MSRYTKEEVQNKYASLDDSIRSTIKSVDTSDKVLNIGQNLQLHFDQIGKLAEEVDYLLIGLTKREEFVGVLQRELGVDEEKATAIARDVNDEILSEIRSALRERTDAPNEIENRKLKIENRDDATTDPLSPPAGGLPQSGGEGDDSREALLREIESPSATPISGRAVRPEGIRNQESGIRMATNEVPTTPTSIPPLTLTPPHPPAGGLPQAGEEDVPTVNENPLPASPLDKGEGTVTPTAPPTATPLAPAQTPPQKPTVDPYREIPL